MRLDDALKFMEPPESDGYRVAFEERERSVLKSDFFPAGDEAPINDFSTARQYAEKFARHAPSRFVNIYVVFAKNHRPVPSRGHGENEILREYPEGD